MAGSETLGFKVKSVSHFLKHLKELGERLLPVFKKKVRYEMNQFVAAAIVSHKEIENEDISIIYEANRKLDVACENLSDIVQDSCFSFNRLVVLMNTTKPARHGEARLFDPDVKIRKEILGIRAIGLMDDNNTNFLDNLKSMFANDFKTKRLPYIMCIFSHNIPCTEQSHQCAKIIDEFA
ncbi:ARMC8 [Mytilus edulis]|uniref:ARMC8 n=1 Tax=Mytilus edulis TaxID=6550 RepID=A0A8S3V1S4_MYTED|nr:ARMC8 [Mytilus edulis]